MDDGTRFLHRIDAGVPHAAAELLPRVYDDICRGVQRNDETATREVTILTPRSCSPSPESHNANDSNDSGDSAGVVAPRVAPLDQISDLIAALAALPADLRAHVIAEAERRAGG
jgi:hypothetical protein